MTVMTPDPVKVVLLLLLFAGFAWNHARAENSGGSGTGAQDKSASISSDTEAVSGVPRIILTDKVLARLKSHDGSDIGRLLADADRFLDEPTIADEFRDSYGSQPGELHRLGEKSVERLTTLGMAWRLTGKPRYAQRGRAELLGLSALETWYPDHFLGLSRITLAVALGYSWLGDALGEHDRQTIGTALSDKALREGLNIYDRDEHRFDSGWVVPHLWVPPVAVPDTLPDGTATADISWPVASFNWNIVCNVGMAIAALAVTDAQPDLAAQVLTHARTSLLNGLAHFAPDGAWPEGPMYGALSGRDAAILISGLESVYGHDFGLSKTAGMPGFGDFLMHVTGPTGLLFNYGDSETSTDPVVLPWLSVRFGRPDYDWRKTGAPGLSLPAFNLIWRQSEGVSPTAREPTALWFGRYGIVTMRSAWNDPTATYIAFKAGPVQSHHNNLDAGTFVIDAKGVRWAVDLGLGNYGLPGYFTSDRFDYYRTATIGQNTLTIDGANQRPTGRAFVEDFAQFPGFNFSIADLSDAYGSKDGSVRRGVALLDGDAVLIQDEVAIDGDAAWTMHTKARVATAGGKAMLSQDGEQMTATILSPPGATFDLRSADPCETPYNAYCDRQNPNAGIQRLMISTAEADPKNDLRRITVLISGDEAPVFPVIPLDEWRLSATFRQGANGSAAAN